MLAHVLTGLRILIALLLPIAAYRGEAVLFSMLYIIALITDVADGMVARRLKQTNSFGKRLDILADEILAFSVIISLYFLNPGVGRYIWQAIFVVMFFVALQTVSYYRTKTFVFRQTVLGRVAAWVFPLAALATVWFDLHILIEVYLFIMILALADKASSMWKSKKTVVMMILALVVLAYLLMPRSDRVCFERACVTVEIRDTYEGRQMGLMHRTSLEESEGMLFVFEQPDMYRFWMKNMNFPIDIIFLDVDARVVEIHHNVPACTQDPCPTYPTDEPALYVVETVAGFAQTYQIEEGDLVSLPLDIST